MISATALAALLVPVFFVVVSKVFVRKAKPGHEDVPAEGAGERGTFA